MKTRSFFFAAVVLCLFALTTRATPVSAVLIKVMKSAGPKPAPPPKSPDHLGAVVISPFEIDLTWKDHANNEDGFQIERAAGHATFLVAATVGTNVTTFRDTGLTPNTQYSYRVRAFNSAGVSSPSNVKKISTPQLPCHSAPDAMQWITQTILASNKVYLSWTNHATNADSIVIERAADTNGSGPGDWSALATVGTNIQSLIDTNVTMNVTYYYRIHAHNFCGDSDFAASEGVVMELPPAPVSVFASVASTPKVIVQWSDYWPDLGYRIERTEDNDPYSTTNWLRLATIAPTNTAALTYDDTAIQTNLTYWYRLVAFNALGDSPYSDPSGVTVSSPPPPAYISGSLGGTNQVNLSWWEYYPGAVAYKLERAPYIVGAPGDWTEIADFSPADSFGSLVNYLDTNALANTRVFYRARAYNWIGLSDYSDGALVEILAPDPPYSLSATPFKDEVQLYWYDSSSRTIDGYNIERADDVQGSPGTWTRIGTTAANYYGYFFDTNRTAGATYWYRVRAFNWVGESDPAAAATATIVPPSMPYYVTASITVSNAVTLNWTDYAQDADGYLIEKAPDVQGSPGTWQFIGAAPGDYYPTFYDTNVTANTTNWYRVRATNVVGTSAYSDPGRIAIVAPTAPYSIYVYHFIDTAQLSWYEDYYGYPQGYIIERAPDVAGTAGTFARVGSYETTSIYGSFPDPGLAAGATYWYRVRAFNWVGESQPSYTANVTIVPPSPPSVLYATIGMSNQVNVSWYDFTGEAAGYRIERAPDANGSPGAWTQIGDMVSSNFYSVSFTDSNVTAFTTNWYRVRAYNIVGVSDYTVPTSIAIVLPPQPLYLYGYVYSPTDVSLNWSEYYYGILDGTKIERALDNGGVPGDWSTIGSAPFYDSYYNDTTVTSNNVYWYRVSAQSWVGTSDPSDAARVSLFPPQAPTELTVSSLSLTAFLSWAYPVESVNGFKVQRALDDQGQPGTWTELSSYDYSPYFYDYSLTQNTTYWYRVVAFNNIGDSAPSAAVSVTIAPPPAPINLVANSASARAVNLVWTPGSTDYSGFDVERAPDAGGAPGTWNQFGTAPVPGYVDPGPFSPGSIYWYRVRAYNDVGKSPYSNPISVSISDSTPLRVMQWNVEKGLGRQANINSSQAQAIARIINFNQPDVMLFSEIDAQNLSAANNATAISNWVNASLPYLSGQPFYVSVSPTTDGFNRNVGVSRFPIVNEFTLNDDLRGLHAFRVQISPEQSVQFLHTHLKCCSDDCPRKQAEADTDAILLNGLRTGMNPIIFTGDLNEDEEAPLCTVSSTYHPITTIKQAGHFTDFRPVTLDGDYHTWRGPGFNPARFDYIFSWTNRLAPISGYVFSSMVWANHGLYPNNYYDSDNASDHYCVFADYVFPNTHFSLSTPQSQGLLDASGPQGGPFTPAAASFTISNVTTSTISWAVTNGAAWVTPSASNGTLAAGATTNIIVSLTATANGMTAGAYVDTIGFVNTSNGAATTVTATLQIGGGLRPIGTDISGHQPAIDWNAVQNGGVSFAWAKATEGITYTSPEFASQISNAVAKGIYIGAYHYAHPANQTNVTGANSADSEADHFWKIAGPYVTAGGQYLVPMLDWEDPDATIAAGFTAEKMSAWANEWCSSVSNHARASGVLLKPVIYTGGYFSIPSSTYPGFTTAVTNWPNWMASYPPNPDPQNGAPDTTYPWSSWNIWQYADTNWSGGDSDVFNGTTNDFVTTFVIGANGTPVISVPPASITTNIGATVTFTVAASGIAPLGYQWRFNQTLLPGATAQTLTVANVQLADSGNYSVEVSNPLASIVSASAILSVIAPVTNASGAVVAPANMVNWWPAEGNANDIYSGNNGTPFGGVSFVSGETGLAFQFNGSSYITTSTASLPPPWTLSLWLNRQDASGQSAALLSDGTYALKAEQYNNTRQIGITQIGVGDYTFGYVAPTGTWVHVVLVGTTTNVSLYANGQFINSLSISVPLPRAYMGCTYVAAGNRRVDYLLATMDEVMTFNRALSSFEIGEINAAGSAGIIRAPELTATVAPGHDAVWLNLRGLTGKPFTVYSSPDLLNWTVFGTFANPSGSVQYPDSNFLAAPQNFYRATQP